MYAFNLLPNVLLIELLDSGFSNVIFFLKVGQQSYVDKGQQRFLGLRLEFPARRHVTTGHTITIAPMSWLSYACI